MKFKIIIDENCEEEVLVYAKAKTALTDAIESLVSSENFELIGYKEKELKRLDLTDIYCFLSESNKVFAVLENEQFSLKQRLYKIEEKLPRNFVKINQSCIANCEKIERFDASVSGTLKVVFKNGYTDFVSRRQLKNVKERLGL